MPRDCGAAPHANAIATAVFQRDDAIATLRVSPTAAETVTAENDAHGTPSDAALTRGAHAPSLSAASFHRLCFPAALQRPPPPFCSLPFP